MFILSSLSGGLEFGSVSHALIYENFELKPFKNLKCLGEICNNWPHYWLGINLRLLNLVDNHC